MIQILTITDLSRGGAGVSRDEQGRVVFVPFTAPGDRVRVRIIEQEKRFAQAELLEVIEPGPNRQTPPCPVFGQCGGCQWQHLPYEVQWQTKGSGVKHALKRVGVTAHLADGFLWEEFPAERIWEYRNRVQLRCEDGQVGFYAPKSHRVIPVERCWIARPEINAEIASIREEAVKRGRPSKVEVDVLPSGEVRKAWNARHAALGFRQVHEEQNEKIRTWLQGALTPERVLYDLFGGSGNFSLPLVTKMKHVHCVDVSAPSHPQQGQPENLSFHRSDVSRWLAHAKSEFGSAPAAAVLDPPREGLADGFAGIEESLRRMGVSEVVAIGCDPDSWAKDVYRFTRRGWSLERAAVFDLFPQTPHVESVARLIRPS